jgi:2'-5' RNA ligase
MSVAIIVTFDSSADARIRRFWSALEAEDLIVPNLGRPHITLAQIAPDDLGRAADALAEVAAGVHGTRLMVDSLGLFPGAQPVLFLNPVVNAGLLALHRRVHDALRKVEIAREGTQGHYLPGSWVPHLTLGRLRKASCLGEALMIANGFRLRFEMTGVALMAMRTDAICPS